LEPDILFIIKPNTARLAVVADLMGKLPMHLPGISKITLVVVMVMLPCAGQTHGQSTPPAKESVDELILLLASKDFKDRERAAKLLVERKDAVPALKKALQSADLEVATRIQWIFKKREQQHALQALPRLKALVKMGAVDQVAELLAQWPLGTHEAACWQEVRTLMQTLLDLHDKQSGQTKISVFGGNNLPEPKVITGLRIMEIAEHWEDVRFIRAGQVSLDGRAAFATIACSGYCKCYAFGTGAILAGGDVDVRTLADALIVSDGDVSVYDGFRALVIARGTVACTGGFSQCHVICGKKLIVEDPRRLMNCKVTENAAMPLGFITFFDPAREGVEVEPAKVGVRVKAVDGAKAFAKAGLRPGDVIVAVDGEIVDSVDVFRRLLRHSLIVDDGLSLRVLRNGRTHDVWLNTPW
jgi:hypothetical protein